MLDMLMTVEKEMCSIEQNLASSTLRSVSHMLLVKAYNMLQPRTQAMWIERNGLVLPACVCVNHSPENLGIA